MSYTVTVMDVSEDMDPRFHHGQADLHLLAAEVLTSMHLVQDAEGWAMSNKDIRPQRDLVPDLAKSWTSPGQVKGPIQEPWLPGGAPKLHPLDFRPGILEIGNPRVLGQKLVRHVRVTMEKPIVVPGDEDLMAVGLAGEPGEKSRHLV